MNPIELRQLFNENKKKYYRTEHWKELRLDAWINANGRCNMCNKRLNKFQVHHTNYDFIGFIEEEVKYLRVLCPRCHKRHHNK